MQDYYTSFTFTADEVAALIGQPFPEAVTEASADISDITGAGSDTGAGSSPFDGPGTDTGTGTSYTENAVVVYSAEDITALSEELALQEQEIETLQLALDESLAAQLASTQRIELQLEACISILMIFLVVGLLNYIYKFFKIFF